MTNKTTILLKDFLNTATDLKKGVLLQQGSCFQADVYDGRMINYNLNQLKNNDIKAFRAFWTAQYPMLKGFANITLVLLHELGHLETDRKIRKQFTLKKRAEKIRQIEESFADDFTAMNNEYFGMVDERLATEWGVKWLSVAENRKIAKAFEKEFFALVG